MLFKEFEEHLGDSFDNKADGNFNNKGNKKAEIGKLKDVPINFLKTYNIDSKKIIPSDKTIKEIREKIVRLKEK